MAPRTQDLVQQLYEPLGKNTDEIRLLEILPSLDDSSLIEIRLIKYSLVDDLKYVALSYVWGDASITEDIIVNGHTLAVTTNLAAALRSFRGHILPHAIKYQRLALHDPGVLSLDTSASHYNA
jgi:hypothetical protein